MADAVFSMLFSPEAIVMKNKLILLAMIMLADLAAFADIFPLIQVEVQSKSMLNRPLELVKLFINPGLSDKSVLPGRARINNRVKGQPKNRDPFKKRQRPLGNNGFSGRRINGLNYSLAFSISKKVIFRPHMKNKE